MNITEIKSKLKEPQYDFLKDNEYLGNNIILLGLGGSYAYGTNVPTSDLDIRGVALNSKEEILLRKDFASVVDVSTDTTIYSFNKIIEKLSECNPNTIELLGLKPEHYIYLTNIGKELLDNKELFLSKKAIKTFAGYANSQLYKLNQKAAHQLPQKELEEHILKTLQLMKENFNQKYSSYPKDSIHLYTDKAVQEEYDTEIFMDISLHHYPLRDYASMWNELQNTVKAYEKTGKRNQNAIEHGKIAKHMMHLVRLYIMGLDILKERKINTFRGKEHGLLMDIRNGKYLNKNNQPIPEFMEIVREYDKEFEYASKNTDLPDEPDYKKINEFAMSVNERIVNGNIKKEPVFLENNLEEQEETVEL